jgi:hypothetical protein
VSQLGRSDRRCRHELPVARLALIDEPGERLDGEGGQVLEVLDDGQVRFLRRCRFIALRDELACRNGSNRAIRSVLMKASDKGAGQV